VRRDTAAAAAAVEDDDDDRLLSDQFCELAAKMAVALRLAIRLGITNSDRLTTDGTSIDCRFFTDGAPFFAVCVFFFLSGGFFLLISLFFFFFAFAFVTDDAVDLEICFFAGSLSLSSLPSLSSLFESDDDESEEDELLLLLLLLLFLLVVTRFLAFALMVTFGARLLLLVFVVDPIVDALLLYRTSLS